MVSKERDHVFIAVFLFTFVLFFIKTVEFYSEMLSF